MSRYDELADAEFDRGFPTSETIETLRTELVFQRGPELPVVASGHQHLGDEGGF
ncbi:hypothetical protein [Gordonia terrae]|uniref:hypothetical protein n=1 Tax=Gordonia terrae TaxID=2055 RepID=UPI00193097DD|nr:hypothetical protein [Gordonia terrae]